MIYSHKPILESLFIFTLLLVPITKAASKELPQQFNQQQTQMMETNKKIAELASDQQRTSITIAALQTSLNTVHQEINDLKTQHDKLVATSTGIQRTANGHGRGGRR